MPNFKDTTFEIAHFQGADGIYPPIYVLNQMTPFEIGLEGLLFCNSELIAVRVRS